MSTGTDPQQEFDVEAYQAEHGKPSEAESAILTVVLFVAMLIFTVGCTMLGWFR